MSEELVRAEITRIDHLLSSSTEDSDLSYLSIEVEKLCKILQKLPQEVSKKFLPLLEEISSRATKLGKVKIDFPRWRRF